MIACKFPAMIKLESSFLTNKSVLIFGGTGSIGSGLVKRAIEHHAYKIRVFSNDENALYEMEQEFSNVECIIGDIRNKESVINAMKGIDVIFHAAALKHVDRCESNPIEAVRTNIIGTHNILESLDGQRLIFISTDKAVNPSSVMGATKLIGEKMVLLKNNCITIRLGNVLFSRGSVFPKIRKQIENGGPVTITDKRMTRYFILLDEAVDRIIRIAEFGLDKKIYVPKMKLYNLIDVFGKMILDSNKEIKIIETGIRPGEKLNEFLLTDLEKESCVETAEAYII